MVSLLIWGRMTIVALLILTPFSISARPWSSLSQAAFLSRLLDCCLSCRFVSGPGICLVAHDAKVGRNPPRDKQTANPTYLLKPGGLQPGFVSVAQSPFLFVQPVLLPSSHPGGLPFSNGALANPGGLPLG